MPRSVVHLDPRRRGRRAMLAVWCWCGRFYTITPEAARRCGPLRACPNPDCGKGEN